jgi:hypothetical protein
MEQALPQRHTWRVDKFSTSYGSVLKELFGSNEWGCGGFSVFWILLDELRGFSEF